MKIFFDDSRYKPLQSAILSVPTDTVVKDRNAEGLLRYGR